MHRILSAALAVLIAGIFAAAPIGAGSADAQAERAATSSANPRDGVRVTAPGATLQQATTSISCNNSNGTITTYTLSVRGGACATDGSGGNGGTASLGSCVNSGNSDEASATCGRGCTKTAGQGSCTQTTN